MEEQKWAIIQYETVMKAQKAIREINKYKGWKTDKYVKNKVTRTENQFKQRTKTSTRNTETDENNREKNKQTGIRDEIMLHMWYKRTQNKRLRK